MKKPQVWHYHYDSSGHARKHLHFGGRVRHEHVNLHGYGQFTSTLSNNERDADKRRVKYFGRSTPSRVDAETAMNPTRDNRLAMFLQDAEKECGKNEYQQDLWNWAEGNYSDASLNKLSKKWGVSKKVLMKYLMAEQNPKGEIDIAYGMTNSTYNTIHISIKDKKSLCGLQLHRMMRSDVSLSGYPLCNQCKIKISKMLGGSHPFINNPGAARHRQEAVSLYKEARATDSERRKALLQVRAAEHVQSAIESDAEGIPNPGNLHKGDRVYYRYNYGDDIRTGKKIGQKLYATVLAVSRTGVYVRWDDPFANGEKEEDGIPHEELTRVSKNPGAEYHKLHAEISQELAEISSKRDNKYASRYHEGQRDAHLSSEKASAKFPNPSSEHIENRETAVWDSATLTEIFKQLRKLVDKSGKKALIVTRDSSKGIAEVKGVRTGRLFLRAMQVHGGWIVRWDGKLIQRKTSNPEIDIKCAFCGNTIKSIKTAKMVRGKIYHPECIRFLKKAQGVR